MSHIIEVNFRPKRVCGVLISCTCPDCQKLKAFMAAEGIPTTLEGIRDSLGGEPPKGAA